MAHRIRLFIGHASALVGFQAIVEAAQLFRLSAAGDVAVLPVDDHMSDALHAVYGTGEWLDAPAMMLTTTDIAFAGRQSQMAPIAYVETDYFGGGGTQSALAWVGGALVLKPMTVDAAAQRRRPAMTWPINAALRTIGIKAAPSMDEFDTVGLGRFRSNEAIIAAAFPLLR